MLTAKKAQKDRNLVVQLIGTVDDLSDFDQVFGPIPAPPTELHINCAQITRINSVGVKSWIRFFQKVAAAKVRFMFWECSPPIVQQMNLVFNFLCGGKVASVQGTFACESCENTFLINLGVAQILSSNFQIPPQKCPKCGSVAEFDDLPKMCFKFLTRS